MGLIETTRGLLPGAGKHTPATNLLYLLRSPLSRVLPCFPIFCHILGRLCPSTPTQNLLPSVHSGPSLGSHLLRGLTALLHPGRRDSEAASMSGGGPGKGAHLHWSTPEWGTGPGPGAGEPCCGPKRGGRCCLPPGTGTGPGDPTPGVVAAPAGGWGGWGAL